MSGLAAEAAQNFAERLAQCAYPGRGLVVGRAPAGGWIQLYWLMGRSPGSRNRVLQAQGAARIGALRQALCEALRRLGGEPAHSGRPVMRKPRPAGTR